MTAPLTAEEYEAQRCRLLDDLAAAREALNRANAVAFEAEAAIRNLDRQWDRQQNTATPV